MQADQDLLQLTYYRGRVALHAILRGLGIGAGDEVATQAFTCVAVPEAILAAGARPVYLDIEADGVNLDPDDIPRKLTPRTRAIIVQHTFGIPANMPAILSLAAQQGLPVIEDCCHTLASKLHGQPVGSFGAAAFYSFEWGKPVVAGLGGSARVNDPQLKETLLARRAAYRIPARSERWKLALQYSLHALLYRPSLYWPLKSAFRSLSRLGIARGNYNALDADRPAEDFSLAMADPQRRRLARKLASGVASHADRSRRLACRLISGLRDVRGIRFPAAPSGAEPVLARFPIQVDDKLRTLALARKQNIELAEWYATPVHPLPVDQGGVIGLDPEVCPRAMQRTGEIVSLPLHERVSERHIDRVIEFFHKAA